jgi:MurNAc alpha-1-phosphate uridylyltransferase
MYCFIPSAGFGTRMKELTQNVPKPLLKISGMSLLEINLKLAYSWGCRNFIVNTHYLADQINRELKNYSNIKIHISKEEKKILGTAGGIKTGFQNLLREDEYILVLNPDAIYLPNSNFNPLQENFSGEILLYLAPSDPSDGNTSIQMKDGKVYFTSGDLYYIGISILRFGVLKDVPTNEYFDLRLIYDQLSASDKLSGKMFEGTVIDLGDKEKYLQNQFLQLPEYTNCKL